MYKQIEEKMRDGRIMLREYISFDNGKTWSLDTTQHLPQQSDEDTIIPSKKYQDKTLGEIYELDKEYIKWFVFKGKIKGKIKKALIRVYLQDTYKRTNDTYDKPFSYYENIAKTFASKNNIKLK